MSEAARVREPIDLAEFERRLRGAASQSSAMSPPAAAAQAAQGGQAAYAVARREPEPERPAFPRSAAAADAARPAANPVGDMRGALTGAAARSEPSSEPSAETFRDSAPEALPAMVEQYPDAAQRFGVAASQAGYAPQAPEVDAWRPDMQEADGGGQDGRSRRRKLLLGAAAAVLVVGVGVTLAMRGGPGGEAPVIRASTEPFKIQPERKPAGEKPNEAATILDRNDSERVAATRMIDRAEQPVDVREAARQASAGVGQPAAPVRSSPTPSTGAPPAQLPTGGPAANGFFPEPRRVRTVSVRPDGTLIGDPAAALAASPARAAAPPPAARAPSTPGPQTQAPVAPTHVASIAPQQSAPVRPAPAPATPPKTTDRAVPPAPPIAAAEPTRAAPPRQLAAAAPQSVAPAPPAAATTGGGDFAVQLAAGSESDARAAVTRFQQRFGAELGGLRPTVRRATVGSREVYRVRVVGLSRSDANSLCERLKASGGACFVARE